MNGIEDRVTSLLTWGLPLGALAFCASLVLLQKKSAPPQAGALAVLRAVEPADRLK